MKQFKLVLTLLISVVAINFQAQVATKSGVTSEEKPQITFKNVTHDFGNINEGDSVETTFEYTNTGNADLKITNIKASCGCTIPSNWSKDPIPPGESGSFTVKFNSKNKPNRQQKRISIICNTEKGSEFVTIKAQVKPDPEKEALRAERRKVVLEQRKERLAKEKAEKLAKQKKSRSSDDKEGSGIK